MKEHYQIVILSLIFLFCSSGCYMKEASVILGGVPLQPVKLPIGSKILICAATPGLVNYEISKIRKEVESSKMNIIYPPANKYKGALLPELSKKMTFDMNADMTFINFEKFHRKVYREVNNPEKNAPHIVLRQYYSSDTYQYNNQGELIGRSSWSHTIPWPDYYSYKGMTFIIFDKSEYTENLSEEGRLFHIANIINADEKIIDEKKILYDVSKELHSWFREHLR